MTGKQKRFGIDIDGTVTCPTSLVPFLNESFSLNITLDDITKYDLSEALNIEPAAMQKWFEEKEAAIYEASPPAPFAGDVLAKWHRSFELLFISARGDHLLDVTKTWFERQQIGYDHIELIGSHHKIEAAKQLQVDLFLEDKHDNAVMLAEELSIPVLLFDTPYNREPAPDTVIRVQTWREADEWVQRWIQTGSLTPVTHN